LHTSLAIEYNINKLLLYKKGVRKEVPEIRVDRREIILIGLLVCLGIVTVFGAYLWKNNKANSKEMEANKQTYEKQAEELQKMEKTDKSTQVNPAGTQNAGSTQPAANPTAPATTNTVPNQPSTSTPQTAVKSTNSIAAGSKVGDVIKLGDVEMVVTKSTTKYKVIDITLKGNTSGQPPKLILTDNNRIVYEIQADVDVNVDVTEKTRIDQSPFFNEEKKAGK